MAISTAVDATAIARVVGIKTIFKDLRAGGIIYLPQRIALVGQGNTALNGTYPLTKRQVASAFEAGEIYGFGSPIYLACLQLLPVNGDGVGTIPVTIYPLDDNSGAVTSAGDITPGGAATANGTFFVSVNNILSEPFTILTGATVADIITSMTAAINAVPAMPVIAVDATPGSSTVCGITAKWGGASGDDINLAVVYEALLGNTFAFTQPTGGATNPSASEIATALAQIGNVWESLVLNCLNVDDTTALDAFNTFGEGRWGALTKKPLVIFTGTAEQVVATAITVPEARKTDRINCQLVSPGSVDLPLVIAARQLARIAVVANNNPPRDYGSQKATGLVPGTDGEQWTYIERDTAVKGGSSTVEVKDGVVEIADTVTFFHPDGDTNPAYRYVCDIIKLQNIIFNLNLIFATDEWDGAPLLPDNDPTTNRSAKKPKMAKAAIATMLDNLGLEAIISDPKTAKTRTLAEISSTNPKRLDIVTTVQLVGNANIISIDLEFGFYFGTPTVVA